MAMAKKVEVLSFWVEKAPALVVIPIKTSLSPELETIREEEEVEEIDHEREWTYFSPSITHCSSSNSG